MQLQYEELDLCRLIVKLDLGLLSSWLFPSINFQFRTETFLSIFLGCQEWPARFWEVQAVGNVVKISIQQRWESRNKHPRKPLQNHRYADLWAKRPKEMVSGRHIKDNKNGKQVNFSFSKIWWASKVSLLAIRNDCVVRSYRFSVPLTCTRAIIRQKVYFTCIFKKVNISWGQRSVGVITRLHSRRSEFTPELCRWISKLTTRHLQILHQKISCRFYTKFSQSFDHHGKLKKEMVSKNEKTLNFLGDLWVILIKMFSTTHWRMPLWKLQTWSR